MIRNTKAETIIGILIWVFIISITVLWIGSLINYSRWVILTYDRSTKISQLKENLINIIWWVNIDSVKENEIFYIYKNKITKEYQVFTWAINDEYKYIDAHGNNVEDVTAFERDIYARILWIEREDTSLENSNKLVRASVRRLIKK
jgi:hypothetical protein